MNPVTCPSCDRSTGVGPEHAGRLTRDGCGGLLDTNPWGVAGYAPAYAQALVKDVVLAAPRP